MCMYIFFLLCYQVESFNLYAHCEQFPYIIPNGMFGVEFTQGIQIYPKHDLLSTNELLTVSDCANGTSFKTVAQRNIHSATIMMFISEECYVTSSIL